MTDQEIINDWLKKNGGARRFESGFAADIYYAREYLASKGVELKYKSGSYSISTGRGRPKKVSRKALFEFIDGLRVSEGKQPIIAKQGTTHD